ncbi:MAG: adenylosuccinate lyase [bacterium]
MLDKYSTEKMDEIWSECHRYEVWWDIERAVVKGWVEFGDVPASDLETIDQQVDWSMEDIKEREQEVKHDMLAFLEVLEDSLGELSRHVHKGLTSSDVKDTESSIRLKESLSVLLEAAGRVEECIVRLAREHRDTVMVGRTHGVHAEPITFGLKCLVWLEEWRRQIRRLKKAREQINVGKMSGAVGTFSRIEPEVEATACEELGLSVEKASNQIIQRDRHSQVFTTLANVAGTIEKIAVEIRNLQRTEILEVQEGFAEGQKGSSAMPHKKNPITAERLSGQARVMRGYASDVLETQSLWHERDLSNSSTERIVYQDGMELLHYMIEALADLLDELGIHEDRMEENLGETNGLIYSQNVMIALTESGWSRNRAYERVQNHAMESWEEGSSFEQAVRNDDEITNELSESELADCFSPQTFLTNIDTIYERVLDET